MKVKQTLLFIMLISFGYGASLAQSTGDTTKFFSGKIGASYLTNIYLGKRTVTKRLPSLAEVTNYLGYEHTIATPGFKLAGSFELYYNKLVAGGGLDYTYTHGILTIDSANVVLYNPEATIRKYDDHNHQFRLNLYSGFRFKRHEIYLHCYQAFLQLAFKKKTDFAGNVLVYKRRYNGYENPTIGISHSILLFARKKVSCYFSNQAELMELNILVAHGLTFAI